MNNKKLIFLAILFFGIFGMAKSSLAANHYINAACSSACDGTTWAKGWATFGAATWTRGDTYYVAGGTYNENLNIYKTASGSTWIYIKKANAADNSGDAGWNASFASAQAVINGGLGFSSSYMSLDGVTGSGNSGHGIKISAPGYGNAVDISDNSFINISHVEIQNTFSGAGDYRGLKSNNSAGPVKGIHLSYLYLHDTSTNGFTFGNIVGTSFEDYGLLYENNYLYNTGGSTDPDNHGQGLQGGYMTTQTYWIIRNSVFHNIIGSGDIVFLGGGATSYINIYNNIFRSDNQSIYWSSPGVIWSRERDANTTTTNLRVYNNTFYNITLNQIAINAETVANNEVKNNLFHTGNFTAGHSGIATAQYNAFYNNDGAGVPSGETGQQNETSDPVVNSAAGDFTLVAGAKSIGNGADLSAVFTTDITGATRTTWDIGAYAYAGATPPPSDTTPPAAPTGLSVN